MQFSSESRAIFRQISDGFCESYPGVLAQLGERKVRNLEVRGSIPLCSTIGMALARNGQSSFIARDLGSQASGIKASVPL